jgi:hypothetical protein
MAQISELNTSFSKTQKQVFKIKNNEETTSSAAKQTLQFQMLIKKSLASLHQRVEEAAPTKVIVKEINDLSDII